MARSALDYVRGSPTRLGLSLAAAAVVSDLPGLTIAEILEAMIAQCEAAFRAASDKSGHLEEPKTVRKVNQRAADASWTTIMRMFE
jgi:hypothetical protein